LHCQEASGKRSGAERVNSALKDSYGGRSVRVRGVAKRTLTLPKRAGRRIRMRRVCQKPGELGEMATMIIAKRAITGDQRLKARARWTFCKKLTVRG
jgi:hypothetical protein